jgi:hypothetical protein
LLDLMQRIKVNKLPPELNWALLRIYKRP